jgi:hypothetical protein
MNEPYSHLPLEAKIACYSSVHVDEATKVLAGLHTDKLEAFNLDTSMACCSSADVGLDIVKSSSGAAFTVPYEHKVDLSDSLHNHFHNT